MEKLPCRVVGDLTRHERDLRDTIQPAFDEHDDALMHDIMGNERLAKPVQQLLISLNQIEMIQASFGDPDKARVFEQLIPELKALRQAVIAEWTDL